jgi:hypothetical protein
MNTAVALPMTSSTPHEAFPKLVERLSEASVNKRYEAFRDIAWDAPESRIDRHDPRLCLGPENALGATQWYASLPEAQRAELGLEYACQSSKIGSSFESVLSRGLLLFSRTLPNRSPAYRYALHEVIEESHHSLMFQQFINQSGCDPQGVNALVAWFDQRVVNWGGSFPELFFVFVLAGEIFIDYENRERLRRRHQLHPLVARITQIHVTEEARHVCFAQRYLQEHLPKLSPLRRQLIRAALPLILHTSEAVMSQPTPRLVRQFGIPRAVLRAAYGPGSPHRAKVKTIGAPVHALLAG